MGLSFSVSDAAFLLKEYYESDLQITADLMYGQDAHVLFHRINKDDKITGKIVPIPVRYAPVAGRSANAAIAAQNAQTLQGTAFQMAIKTDYDFAYIDGRTLKLAANNQGAFLTDAVPIVDSAWLKVSQSIASACYRDGSGVIGQISTTIAPSTGVLTLQNPGDVVNFEINDVLEAATTKTGAARAANGFVVKRDESAGTITVATAFGGAAATPTAWASADFLTVQGDRNNKFPGLDAWVPTVAPTAGDSFNSVDRSVDPTRLAGSRYNAQGQNIAEGFIDGLALVNRAGGFPNESFLNHVTWAGLGKSETAKIFYDEHNEDKDAVISFPSFRIIAGGSSVRCYADKSQQQGIAHCLDMRTWTLLSAGQAPHVAEFEDDQHQFIRVPGQDYAQFMLRAYLTMATSVPRNQLVIQMPQ